MSEGQINAVCFMKGYFDALAGKLRDQSPYANKEHYQSWCLGWDSGYQKCKKQMKAIEVEKELNND